MLDTIIGYLIPLVIKLDEILMEDLPPLKQLLAKVHETYKIFLGDSPSQYSQHWEKFVLLLNILDADLVSILSMYQQSLFVGKFTLSEVKHLICGIFEDNTNRRETLSMLV